MEIYGKMHPDDMHTFNDKYNLMELLQLSELFSLLNLCSVYIFFHGIQWPDQCIYHTYNLTVKLETGQYTPGYHHWQAAAHQRLLVGQWYLQCQLWQIVDWRLHPYFIWLRGASRINWSMSSWGQLWIISTGCAKISVWDFAAPNNAGRCCWWWNQWPEVCDTDADNSIMDYGWTFICWISTTS